MADLKDWNYAIGFGLILLGLLVSRAPATPLGRGRGVVVGMLSCFLIGLIWICTFYVLSGDQLPKVPVFNDLDQYNLMVGHRLHGGRLRLRHALGVSPPGASLRGTSDAARSTGPSAAAIAAVSTAVDSPVENHTRVVLPRFVPSWGQPLR